MFRSKDVKHSNANDRSKYKECGLPSGGHIVVVVQGDKTLNHQSNNLGVDNDNALPTDSGKPPFGRVRSMIVEVSFNKCRHTRYVAENLLMTPRCEFRNPVILTTCRRSPVVG